MKFKHFTIILFSIILLSNSIYSNLIKDSLEGSLELDSELEFSNIKVSYGAPNK